MSNTEQLMARPDVQEWCERLAELIQPHTIQNWLLTPNDSFSGSRPVDLIISDNTESLEAMLWQIRDSVAS